MYRFDQAQDDPLARFHPLALNTAGFLRAMDTGRPEALLLMLTSVSLQPLEDVGTTHQKPPFGLACVRPGDRLASVGEYAVLTTPFCTLRRFAKDVADPEPCVLVIAPLSSYYATRLRGKLEASLREHDVRIAARVDAHEVPSAAGPFGSDDMVAHLVACMEAIAPGVHVLAVSQIAVPAMAAAALLAEDNNPARPRSLALVAGPVGARMCPILDEIPAERLPLACIERATVDTLPSGYPGAGRSVRPGAQQLTSPVLSDLPPPSGHAPRPVPQSALLRRAARGDGRAGRSLPPHGRPRVPTARSCAGRNGGAGPPGAPGRASEHRAAGDRRRERPDRPARPDPRGAGRALCPLRREKAAPSPAGCGPRQPLRGADLGGGDPALGPRAHTGHQPTTGSAA